MPASADKEMTKLFDLCDFAIKEPESRADIQEQISLLTNEELRVLLAAVSMLRNDARTEKIMRDIRSRRPEGSYGCCISR